jgi:hypothetical protein
LPGQVAVGLSANARNRARASAASVIRRPTAAVGALELVIEVGREVGAALGQAGQPERPQVEAGQQIGAEPAGGNLGGEVAVGAGDQHEVADHLGVGADRPPALGLERVEEQRLLADVELAQLVEEQRPAVGRAQVAGPRRRRAGERALDVAEQRAHRAVAA